MHIPVRALIGACAFLAAAPAFATGQDEHAGKSEKFKLIHVDELVSLQKQKVAVSLLDANDPEFRAKNGIIPGARQLSSFNKYDFKELPADKGAKLVFYCANTH
jgi:hypothetical protein